MHLKPHNKKIICEYKYQWNVMSRAQIHVCAIFILYSRRLNLEGIAYTYYCVPTILCMAFNINLPYLFLCRTRTNYHAKGHQPWHHRGVFIICRTKTNSSNSVLENTQLLLFVFALMTNSSNCLLFKLVVTAVCSYISTCWEKMCHSVRDTGGKFLI